MAILQLGANEVIPNGPGKGIVIIYTNYAGTFDLNGYTETINGLSGDGVVTNSTGTSTLIVGDAGTNSTFSGAIKTGTGTVALIKTNTGTLTLSGPNSYTGGTTLVQGKLVATTNATALGSGAVTTAYNVLGPTLELDYDSPTTLANNVTATTGADPQWFAVGRATSGAGVTNTMGTLSCGNQTFYVTNGANVTANTPFGLTFGATTIGGQTLYFDVATNGTAVGTLTLGSLSGNYNFVKQDGGKLILTAAANANRSSATVTLAGGTMVLGGTVGTQDALGTSGVSLTLSGGTLDLATHLSTLAHNTTVSGSCTIYPDEATAGSAGINHTLGTLGIGAYTLTVAGGANVTSGTAQLTFGSVTLSGAPTFTVNDPAGGGTTTFSLGAVANGAYTMTFNGTGDVIQTGVWGNGAGGVTYSGSTGTLTLSQANTYSGTTTLSSGTLNINSTTALGSGTFTITGGTINNTSAGAIVNANNNVQNWNGDFAFTGTKSLNLGTGTVAMNATRQVTVNGGILTVGGIISGSGFGLTKAGTGTLTLAGLNSYSGTTTVSAGTLLGRTGGGSTNSAVTVSTTFRNLWGGGCCCQWGLD